MRHLLILLLVGLHVSPTTYAQSLALNNYDISNVPTQSVSNTTFVASISAIPTTTRLRVLVFNKFNQRLIVELRQGVDDILYWDIINRRTRQYNQVINLEGLPIGSYSLTISNGRQTIKRTLYIDPPYARPIKPTHTILTVKDEF